MLIYLLRRVLIIIPTLLAVSIVAFLVIQAPPGDFLTVYIGQLESRGEQVADDQAQALRVRWGLDQPLSVQYFKWLRSMLRGNMGFSMVYNRPVTELILERLPWSVTISLAALFIVYLIGLPVGMISAIHQYSVRDYVFTVIGFLGLAIPNFLFALVLLWGYYQLSGNVAVGLFSSEYQLAPWSFAKLLDLLKHVWMPALIVGTAGTAFLIRTIRANLLDELNKQYVMVARSKGLSEQRMVYKYPFRIAINPAISTLGWTLPTLVSGELLTSMVLGIPTLAPIFLTSLRFQDMFLAGSIVFVLSVLTVIGTLLSDILLAFLDPRVRGAV